MRIRRRVRVQQVDLCSRRDVRIGPVEQRLPHDSAHQVELVPGLPERLTEKRERSWNLQFLYNDQILVRNGLRVTEALDDQPASAGRTRNGRPPGPLKILK